MTNLVAATPITAKTMKSFYAKLNRQKELKRSYRKKYKDLQAVTATTTTTPITTTHPIMPTIGKATLKTHPVTTAPTGQQKKTNDKGKTKPVERRKKNPPTTTATTSNSSHTLQSQLKDKAKHMAALIQEITEELQAIEEESGQEEQNSDVTQVSDLEQEDSDVPLMEDEQ